MTSAQLFEQKERRDNRRRQPGENWFRFLDRVDDVYFGRVRALINEWFSHLPPEQAALFRSQFVSSDAITVEPAFFELYVHELFRRLEFALAYEPALASTPRRPDFRVTRADREFFVEVRTLGDPEERARSRKLRHAAIEPLRSLRNHDFTIDLRIIREGESAPPTAKLARRIDEWLDTLDREEIARLSSRDPARVPELTLEAGDWVLGVRPIARAATRVGSDPVGGTVSVFPGRSSWGSNSERLLDALKKKAGRYGQLGAQFLIACSIGDVFVDEDDIAAALFGSPDTSGHGLSVGGAGLWSGGANSRVSAVMTVRGLVPSTVSSVTPILWRNPAATHPFDLELPLCAEGRRLTGGSVEIADAALEPHVFFGLAADWPGPERPLRVRGPE